MLLTSILISSSFIEIGDEGPPSAPFGSFLFAPVPAPAGGFQSCPPGSGQGTNCSGKKGLNGHSGGIPPLPANFPLRVRSADLSPTDVPLGVRSGLGYGFVKPNFRMSSALFSGSQSKLSMSPSLYR